MHTYLEVKVTTEQIYRIKISEEQANKLDAELKQHIYKLQNQLEDKAIDEKYFVDRNYIDQSSHVYQDD